MLSCFAEMLLHESSIKVLSKFLVIKLTASRMFITGTLFFCVLYMVCEQAPAESEGFNCGSKGPKKNWLIVKW